MPVKKKATFSDILTEVAGEERKRMVLKGPSWASFDGLSFPTRLSTEQCSSEATAAYKAGLIAGLASGAGSIEIADLTGGLGVDSWAFSKVASRVLHNEMNKELSEAVRKNFDTMGISNVVFSSVEITPGDVSEVLGGFFSEGAEGVVFMDPARRSATGSKVFRLEDCTPDVTGLLPYVFEKVNHVVLKLSPMADIDLTVCQLDAASEGKCREVHAVASGGECKEILVVMERDRRGDYLINCVEEDFSLKFSPAEEKSSAIALAGTEELCGKYLFEPGKSLTKAGAFKLLCSRFNLSKFGVSTHLYLSEKPIEGIPGKWFLIERVCPLDKSSIKSLGKEFPRCEVTARNLPMSSDELRRRLGTKSGGAAHLFALHADRGSENLILVTTPCLRES